MNDHDQNPDVRYESRDFQLRHLVGLALILFLVVGGGLLVVQWWYGRELETMTSRDPRFRFTNAPEYETPIARDFAAMLSENRPRLMEFAWVDHESGLCRIPLHVAEETLAAQGPPEAWKTNAPEHPERKEAYLELRINR